MCQIEKQLLAGWEEPGLVLLVNRLSSEQNTEKPLFCIEGRGVSWLGLSPCLQPSYPSFCSAKLKHFPIK